MIILSHATGNENVRQAAQALQEADLLGEFWTTISWNSSSPLHRLLSSALQQTLARRSFPGSLRKRTHTMPAREVMRLLGGMFDIDSVSRALDRRVAARLRRANFDLVYGYEDMAWHSFRAAAEQGIPRLYDLPIGYWGVAQKIFAEEAVREPEWAATLTGMRDSAAKLAAKDEELRLASRVVVASSFTRETLKAAKFEAAVDVIPYGAPASLPVALRKSSGQKLRVLFVGGLGQRKGLSYLLKAVALLGEGAELTLLGRKAAEGCAPLEAAVRKHRWLPTVPHHAVLQEMAQHDVLVFPSLFEGFGLVLLEAMAQGTPVIATPHTAAPDLIEDGIDGFIVPIRSAEALAEKLETLTSDRARLAAMQQSAQRKAALHTWQNYRRRLVEVARDVINNSPLAR